MSFSARNHPQQTQARPGADGTRPLFEEVAELIDVTGDVDDRATTPEAFAEFDRRFHFTIDVAAAAHNAKLPRFYDRTTDGLTQSWAGERVWCNPPYSDIKPWVTKAWAERRRAPELPAELIVMLLPANRTEQAWWQDLIEPTRLAHGIPRVEFLRGRMRFIAPGAARVGPNQRPPFGVCLVIWGV